MFFALTANRRAAGRSPDAGGRGRRFSRAGSDHSGGCRAARVAAISAEDGRWACMLFSCHTLLHIYTAAVWVKSGFHIEKLHVCLSRRGIILNKLEASWRRERYHHSYLITGCIIETVMLIKADFFFFLLLLWSNYYSAWRTRDHTNYYVSRLNADADSNL